MGFHRVVHRASRKAKSDADLRNDIKEFLSTVGFPENHVPTMKELTQNGRFVSYGVAIFFIFVVLSSCEGEYPIRMVNSLYMHSE